jgi:hypothetical protein
MRQSKPFEDAWNESCKQFYEKEIILQKDTPTRWSSTIIMLQKATTAKNAIERLYNACTGNPKLADHLVCIIFIFFCTLLSPFHFSGVRAELGFIKR